MCFGGGKSADDYYNEMKPEPQPLPSLSMSPMKKREQKMKDVPAVRKGTTQRSLLNPMMGVNNNANG